MLILLTGLIYFCVNQILHCKTKLVKDSQWIMIVFFMDILFLYKCSFTESCGRIGSGLSTAGFVLCAYGFLQIA